MKAYLKRFRFLLITVVVVGMLLILTFVVRNFLVSLSIVERTNSESLTTERVFDYADILTDTEEDDLRELISKREKQAGCDIVLLIINEDFDEYENQGSDYYMTAQNYADDFYDNQKFGYNEAYGDGVLFLDNWKQQSDGYKYYHLSTSGKAISKYSDGAIEHLLERFDSYIETDPYLAYKSYINSVYYDMTGILDFNGYISFATIFIISLIITIFYLFTNLKSNSGKKTVAPTAYVSGGVPIINQQEDLFLNKIVTQHHIQRNSGGGGGGGGSHTSSGGHSHGGGGGRR